MEGAGFSLVGAPSPPQLHPCIICILSKPQTNLDTTSTIVCFNVDITVETPPTQTPPPINSTSATVLCGLVGEWIRWK